MSHSFQELTNVLMETHSNFSKYLLKVQWTVIGSGYSCCFSKCSYGICGPQWSFTVYFPMSILVCKLGSNSSTVMYVSPQSYSVYTIKCILKVSLSATTDIVLILYIALWVQFSISLKLKDLHSQGTRAELSQVLQCQ